MEERKKIDLQRHVSPKVPNKYLWKVLFYCLLLGGLIAFIFYLQDEEKTQQNQAKKPTIDQGQEITDFTIED